MRYLLLVLLFSGCATTFSEYMLPDGKTWSVTVNSKKCHALRTSAQCHEALEPEVRRRGVELCGAPPTRVFACGALHNGFQCNLVCPDPVK